LTRRFISSIPHGRVCARVLFEEKLVPVCRPDLLSDKDIVEQLNTLPRIHRRQNPEAWLHYAGQSGIVLDNPAQESAMTFMKWR
jgi:DNA-binding transcriptional LysR family regulator